MIKTSPVQIASLDEQVTQIIYAANFSFHRVEHLKFVRLMSILRPNYKSHSGVNVADTFLPQVYESEIGKYADKLTRKVECLAFHGCLNNNNNSHHNNKIILSQISMYVQLTLQ